MGLNLNVIVGGEAGQGVQSLGFILAKSLARGGYHVFADQDYESRIRGGHNFFRVRVNDSQIAALIEEVDILVAMNKESLDLHLGKLTKDGVAIFDEEVVKDYSPTKGLLGLPLESMKRMPCSLIATLLVSGWSGSAKEQLVSSVYASTTRSHLINSAIWFLYFSR